MAVLREVLDIRGQQSGRRDELERWRRGSHLRRGTLQVRRWST